MHSFGDISFHQCRYSVNSPNQDNLYSERPNIVLFRPVRFLIHYLYGEKIILTEFIYSVNGEEPNTTSLELDLKLGD
jgi:hypothetical protein